MGPLFTDVCSSAVQTAYHNGNGEVIVLHDLSSQSK
jgi:hypothetical protein